MEALAGAQSSNAPPGTGTSSPAPETNPLTGEVAAACEATTNLSQIGTAPAEDAGDRLLETPAKRPTVTTEATGECAPSGLSESQLSADTVHIAEVTVAEVPTTANPSMTALATTSAKQTAKATRVFEPKPQITMK